MAKKEIRLKAYSIELLNNISDISTLKSDLEEYLINIGNTLEKRMMPIGKIDSTDDVDFISWYKIDANNIFGCILRMKKGIAKSILKEQLQENMISYETIESKENEKNNIEGFVVNRYYFCLNNRYLILALKHNIEIFETYINYLIEKTNNKEYSMESLIKELSLKKEEDFIKKVVLGKKSNITKDIAKKITKGKFLKDILKTFNTFEDYQLDDILEATIILTVKKPDDAKLILKSIPSKYTKVITSSGEVIDGGKYKANQLVKVSNNNNILVEKELRQYMVSFLYKITKNNGNI